MKHSYWMPTHSPDDSRRPDNDTHRMPSQQTRSLPHSILDLLPNNKPTQLMRTANNWLTTDWTDSQSRSCATTRSTSRALRAIVPLFPVWTVPRYPAKQIWLSKFIQSNKHLVSYLKNTVHVPQIDAFLANPIVLLFVQSNVNRAMVLLRIRIVIHSLLVDHEID